MKNNINEMREAHLDYLTNEQKGLIKQLYALEVSKTALKNGNDVWDHIVKDQVLNTVENILKEI